jgi:hypothetical protein
MLGSPIQIQHYDNTYNGFTYNDFTFNDDTYVLNTGDITINWLYL